MTVDALEYLRAQDPAPQGGTAPPVERVLARVQAKAGGGPHRRRLALVPAIAVAVTLAVITVVVLLAVTHRGQPSPQVPPANRTTPSVPTPTSLMPRGGMRGALYIQAAASAAGGHALINFNQCEPCYGRPAASIEHLWLATTGDSGRSWQITHASLDLTMLAFSGADGWAEGSGSDRTLRFLVTHDGGRDWQVASSPDPAPGWGDVSVAGGEAWSLGNACVGTRCVDAILRAPAAGARLVQTAAQPPLGHSTDVSVVATGRNDAYVFNDSFGTGNGLTTVTATRMFATHDGGRTWRSVPTPCPRVSSGHLYRGGAGALWAVCQQSHGVTQLTRSTDGGRHWTPMIRSQANIELQPASAQVAWAVSPAGRILRSTDGGRTWTAVWYGGHPEPAVLAGIMPSGLNRAFNVVLTVASASTATVIAQVSRGHVDRHPAQTDFVTYRTTDGGQTWHPSVVRLPSG